MRRSPEPLFPTGGHERQAAVMSTNAVLAHYSLEPLKMRLCDTDIPK